MSNIVSAEAVFFYTKFYNGIRERENYIGLYEGKWYYLYRSSTIAVYKTVGVIVRRDVHWTHELWVRSFHVPLYYYEYKHAYRFKIRTKKDPKRKIVPLLEGERLNIDLKNPVDWKEDWRIKEQIIEATNFDDFKHTVE